MRFENYRLEIVTLKTHFSKLTGFENINLEYHFKRHNNEMTKGVYQ